MPTTTTCINTTNLFLNFVYDVQLSDNAATNQGEPPSHWHPHKNMSLGCYNRPRDFQRKPVEPHIWPAIEGRLGRLAANNIQHYDLAKISPNL